MTVRCGSLRLADCADSVREPAVEERLVGRPPLGKTQVPLALKCLERAQQNRLSAPLSARREIRIERVLDTVARHTTGITDTIGVATQPGQVTQPLRADSAFISEVDASNAAEIRLARMAESRSQDPVVKRFAENMVADHERLQTEWRLLSSRSGLQVRADINPNHQEQVTGGLEAAVS